MDLLDLDLCECSGEQVPECLDCSGRTSRAGGESDGDPLAVSGGSLSGASVQRRLLDHRPGGRHATLRRQRPPALLSGEVVTVSVDAAQKWKQALGHTQT